MRALLATAVLLAAVGAAAAAAVEAEHLEEIAAWARAEAARIRAGAGAEEAKGALESLKGLRERLERAGLGRDLAAALAPFPTHRTGGGAGGRATAALEAARRRVETFARASRRPAATDLEGARARLETILAEPLFAEAREIGAAGWLRAWLLRQVVRLREWLQGALATYGAAVTVAACAVIAGALLVIAWLLSGFPGFGVPSPSRIPRVAGGGGSRRTAAEEILALGVEEARGGRLLAAVKLYVLAAVTALRARGEIPGTPGLTDLEAARCLGEDGPPGDRTAFGRLAAFHDAAVYGGRGAGQREAGEAEGLARAIVRPPREVPA